jgi:hypothetical protein
MTDTFFPFFIYTCHPGNPGNPGNPGGWTKTFFFSSGKVKGLSEIQEAWDVGKFRGQGRRFFLFPIYFHIKKGTQAR